MMLGAYYVLAENEPTTNISKDFLLLVFAAVTIKNGH